MQASSMPQLTLSLPAALGALALILLIGASSVYFSLRAGITGQTIVEPTLEGTATQTATMTLTATETLPPTAIPTETPLPPFDYTVKSGDTCGVIAANFGVSVQSIIVLNQLSSQCFVSVGQPLKIPYPTSTPAPPPGAEPDSAPQFAFHLRCAVSVLHIKQFRILGRPVRQPDVVPARRRNQVSPPLPRELIRQHSL